MCHKRNMPPGTIFMYFGSPPRFKFSSSVGFFSFPLFLTSLSCLHQYPLLFFPTSAQVFWLTIKELLSSCTCSDWPNSLSLLGLLECKFALNASSWSNESYLDCSRIFIVIQDIVFHIKCLCQTQGSKCLSFFPEKLFISESLLCRRGKIFSYPGFPAARSGIVSFRRPLVLFQSKTLLAIVLAVGGIQLTSGGLR